VIVVDSSALVAILRREPEADRFLQVIAEADGCLLSSVSLLETSMVLAGRTGNAASWADLGALLARAAMQVVSQDAGLVEEARSAFLRTVEAAIPPLSTLATARPMPSPKPTACRCCSKGTISPGPICWRPPDTAGHRGV
jgi:predicted nucleic acid-binding protein